MLVPLKPGTREKKSAKDLTEQEKKDQADAQRRGGKK